MRLHESLTKQQQDALVILFRYHPKPCRESNATTERTDLKRGYVHWKVAQTLLKQGLATWSSIGQLTLTGTGVATASACVTARAEQIGGGS